MTELAGAELVVGDQGDPATIAAAFIDVRRLYYVPPTMPGWNVAQSALLDLAAAAGVEYVVRISALGTRPDAASMSLRYHWCGERELERSGLAYTHVRCNSFFQNTLFDAPSIKRTDAFSCCVGGLRFAKVDTRDVGEVIATVLTTPGHESRAYTLTGSEPLSYADMAEVMSDVLARRITYVDLGVEEWARGLVSEGFPAWLADEFAAIYGLGFDDPSVVENPTDTVARLLGRAPRTFREFVAQHRDQFE